MYKKGFAQVIAVLVFTIVILFTAGFYYFSNQRSNQINTVSDLTKHSPITTSLLDPSNNDSIAVVCDVDVDSTNNSNSKVCTNKNLLIEFEYPKTAELSIINNKGPFIGFFDNIPPLIQVRYTHQGVSREQTHLEEGLVIRISKVESSGNTLEELSNQEKVIDSEDGTHTRVNIEKTTLNNFETIKASYSNSPETAPELELVYLNKKGTVYKIQGYYNGSYKNEYLTIYNNFLSTLRFTG